ncbi:MAG: NUDIX hydrolase [Candidatus Nanohalobium sp.]
MVDIEGRVALSVVENSGEYLFMRRSPKNSSSGKWTFPGGKIEEGETVEEAAVREAKEETGLETEVVRKGEPYLNVGELGKWKVYPVLLKSDSREVEMSEEHDRYDWIKIGEIKDYNSLGKVKAPERLDLK